MFVFLRELKYRYSRIPYFITNNDIKIKFLCLFCLNKQIDELLAHSHKFRVPISERSGLRGLQRNYGYDSMSTPPLVALTHASHLATRSPGCNVKGNQVSVLITTKVLIKMTQKSIEIIISAYITFC